MKIVCGITDILKNKMSLNDAHLEGVQKWKTKGQIKIKVKNYFFISL